MIDNGYQVIDLKGAEIDSTGVEIEGIYAKLEALEKMALFINADVDGVGEIPPFTASVYVENSSLCVDVNASTRIVISSDDTITAEAIGGSGGGGISYSTEEQDTGLKWLDDKSIYQKTFTYEGDIGTTTTTIYTDSDKIVDTLVDMMVVIDAKTFKNVTTVSSAFGNFRYGTTQYQNYFWYEFGTINNYIKSYAGSPMTGIKAYVTIKYTKS